MKNRIPDASGDAFARYGPNLGLLVFCLRNAGKSYTWSRAVCNHTFIDCGSALMPTANLYTELCFSLSLEDGKAPDWIEILPGGDVIEGRDGRTFERGPNTNTDILARFKRFKPLPLDWEHAAELRAPKGEKAPSAGWLTELRFDEDGSLWARMDWSKSGRADVEGREYRFISPALLLSDDRKTITGISSAGLVGKPNFDMTALNSKQTEGAPSMDAIAKALGLVSGANEAQILEAINALRQDRETALNAARNPDVNSFVPVAELNAAKEKVQGLEAELNAARQQKHDDEVTRIIDAACEAGKITPASKDYYKGTCATEEGLNSFRAFVDAQPEIAGNSGLEDKETPAAGALRSLTNAQKELCSAMGIAEEVYLQTLQEGEQT